MEKISRTVSKLSNSPQLSLFEPSPQKLEKPSVGAPRFNDPSPHTILIAQQTLHQFLQDTKQTEVFLIRDLVRSLDFSSFISRYSANGRPAYHPALMLSLVLFAVLEQRSSLRSIEAFAKSDLRCMWLTGGAMPDHSIIGRFILKHQDLLSEKTFVELTSQIVQKTKSRCVSLAGDGTVVESAASSFRLISQEAAELKASKATKWSEAKPEDLKLAKSARQALKVAQIAKDRSEKRRKNKGAKVKATRVSPSDPEAVLQPQKTRKMKNKRLKLSYKPSILANADRIIVAQRVEPSSETKAFPQLFNQAQSVARDRGESVEQVMLDAGYLCSSILALALREDLDLLCPSGNHERKGPKNTEKRFLKSDFEYNQDLDVYICPAGEKLRRRSTVFDEKIGQSCTMYRGTPEICRNCELKDNCTTSMTRGRQLKRYEFEELKEAQREVMEQELAKKAYKKRQGRVEPVFSALKEEQGLRRLKRRGLKGARVEFALHALSYNLKRCVILLGRANKEGHSVCFAILVWWEN